MINQSDVASIIAHRGGMLSAPENSMAAFQNAVRVGCSWVEFDVQQTRDQVLVVTHDETLQRQYQDSRKICEVNWSELETFDGNPQTQIPQLNSLLDFLEVSGQFFNLEIKSQEKNEKENREFALAVCQCLEKRPALENKVLISSFNFHVLSHVKQELPQFSLGLLCHIDDGDREWHEKKSQLINTSKDLTPFSIHTNANVLTPSRVTELKQIANIIMTYTVNDPNQAKALLSWGVNSIFTDDVHLIESI